MTVLESIKLSTDFLEKKGIESPRLNAEILLAEVLKCKRIDLYVKFDQPLKNNEVDQYREWIARRGKYEPLQYIIGKVDFYGLTFRVTPEVLIPRPETELLVDKIINDYKDNSVVKILEIGVGSGCIAVSIAKNLLGSEVTGIDISDAAIKVAAENSDLCGINGNLKLFALDIRNYSNEEKFDLIVSNPPYVSKEEFGTLQKEIKDYEPLIAVTDQNDGLEFYRIISGKLNSLLNPGGKVYFEIGKDQTDSVIEILKLDGIANIRTVKDFQNIDRILIGEKQ